MKSSVLLLKTRVEFVALIIIVLSVCLVRDVNAQGVGINPSGNLPDNSAGLDVNFTNKGALVPRMATTQRDAITSPANSLIIFNTDVNCFQVYNGIQLLWENLYCYKGCATAPAQPSVITGNTSPCSGTLQTYSVTNVNGVTYSWTFPAGWSQTAGTTTNSAAATVGSFAGNIQVIPSNACGSGTVQTLAVTPVADPAAPAQGSHTASSIQIIWNWNTVSGATGYKYNTANDYSTATNNGNNTSYTQTGLSCGNAYTLYVWAYNVCTNSAATTLTQSTVACPTCGTQIWASANLNVGTMISTASNQTNNGIIEKYCYNNIEANCALYGGLYQWDEVMAYAASINCDPCGTGGRQGICPSGYHIPTDLEWSRYEHCIETTIAPTGSTTLATFQTTDGGFRGTNSNVGPGAKMKATSSNTPAWNGTNASGFNAVPAGYRNSNTLAVETIDETTYIWSATQQNSSNAYVRHMYTGNSNSWRGGHGKISGSTVRCLKN